MEEIFADTSYWLALFDPRDSLRAQAIRAEDRLASHFRMVTSDPVIVEVLNALSKENIAVKHEAVLHFRTLREDPSHLIIPLTHDLFIRSEKMYLRFADKNWSFVDCSSFIIMRERSIRDALTYDHHFEQAGFRAILREA